MLCAIDISLIYDTRCSVRACSGRLQVFRLRGNYNLFAEIAETLRHGSS